MGKVVLAGASSGSTTLQPADTVTVTITLPSVGGTIQTSGTGYTTNCVAYATSTSALTTGSGLVFDGTNLGVGTSSPAQILSLYTNLGTGSGVGTSISMVADGSGGDQGYIGINKGSGNGFTFGEQNRDFIWQTGNTTPFNGTERMRLNQNGALILAGGTTTANGVGITFPATQSASSNANTLDDYEEGTWTPTIGNISNTGTLTITGTYTKIGNQVYITVLLDCTGVISWGVSALVSVPFTGIPNSHAFTMSQRANGESFLTGRNGTQLTFGEVPATRFFVGYFPSTDSGVATIFSGTYRV